MSSSKTGQFTEFSDILSGLKSVPQAQDRAAILLELIKKLPALRDTPDLQGNECERIVASIRDVEPEVARVDLLRGFVRILGKLPRESELRGFKLAMDEIYCLPNAERVRVMEPLVDYVSNGLAGGSEVTWTQSFEECLKLLDGLETHPEKCTLASKFAMCIVRAKSIKEQNRLADRLIAIARSMVPEHPETGVHDLLQSIRRTWSGYPELASLQLLISKRGLPKTKTTCC